MARTDDEPPEFVIAPAITTYRLTQAVLACGAARFLNRRIAALAGAGNHLDVGCGPRSCLSATGIRPIGIDISQHRVSAYARDGLNAMVGSATALPFPDRFFDGVWSFGLLHHLNDIEARRAIGEMLRVTRKGGRTVVFDGILPDNPLRHPLAGLIRHFDRGRELRSSAKLRDLLGSRWDIEHVTYSYTGLEGLLCVLDQ